MSMPSGSQDDSCLNLGEESSNVEREEHQQTNAPAPHSAPRRLLSSPDKPSHGPPSPTVNVSSRGAPSKPDWKGKGKAKEELKSKQSNEPTESFLKRLAGPSTGKAGLLRDPEEVRQIIWQASKGSKFAENEQKRDEATTAQVQSMLDRLEARLQAKNYNVAADEREMEHAARVYESERHLDETVVVVDADAFYASVEELLDPSLKGKAFGVGSGVLTTASYEARRFGCRSAMAGFVAKKLCPHIIFVKPKFHEYSAASDKIMNILREYDPNMSPASLDEAFMNITAHLSKTGQSVDETVAEMRGRVKEETGLTVSAGAGVNKLIAKIAADINKPDGQCVVPPTRAAVLDFLHKMPVRKIPGIGRVTERWLDAVAVKTVGDIWTHRGKLNLLKEEMHTDWLMRKYLGLGSSAVEPAKRENRKSVGCEETFSTIWKEADLFEQLRHIADSLAGDLERLRFSGRTITLKLKLDTYELLTRAHTSGNSIFYSAAEDLFRIGKSLLDKELVARYKAFDSGKGVQGCKGVRDLRIRLMGLRATNLRDEDAASKGATTKNALANWMSAGKAESRREVIDLDSDPLSDSNGGIGEDVDEARSRTGAPPPAKKAKHGVKLVSAHDQSLANVMCPTCERRFKETSLSMFNHHLDRCLSSKTSAHESTMTSKSASASTPLPVSRSTSSTGPSLGMTSSLASQNAFSAMMANTSAARGKDNKRKKPTK